MLAADGSRLRNAQQIDRRLLWLFTAVSVAACLALGLLFAGRWNWPRGLLCGAVALAALCFTLSLWSQQRFWWASRVLGGMVCLGFLTAVARLSWFPTPGSPGPHLPLLFLAVVGFMVCGVPALSFTLWGHTRGKAARADAVRITSMDRWTSGLIPLLGYAAWFATGIYLLSLLVP